MHILIAPNAFKDSLNATDAALAIQKGLQESMLSCTCECFPIGDGGDGTADLLIHKFDGAVRQSTVHDALGRKINASYGILDNGQTAVIEMANAAGIRLLQKEELQPLSATSFGTGQQIKAALDEGVKKIIIGMGGSATIDGGVGILKALGARFLDVEEDELLVIPADLTQLNSIDLSQLDKRLTTCEVIVLCDVENILLGKNGAAAVFGPQKGASETAIEKLNQALSAFADITLKTTGVDISSLKHGGTAGGAAAGLAAFLGARLVNGIDYFLHYTDFESAVAKADLVITGEGSIDEQTLRGKGPYGVAKSSKQRNLPVVGFAGRVPLMPSIALEGFFDVLLPINHQALNLVEALPFTETNLTRSAIALGNALALKNRIDS